MTISAWTVTLAGSWSAGPGLAVQIDEPGPTGFGGGPSRNTDMPRGTWPGSTSGLDIPDATVGSIPLFIDKFNATDAWNTFETLRGAWAPSRASDVTVTFGDPRGVDRTWYGRPDGLRDYDLSRIDQGYISCLAAFRCLDPYGYGAATTVSSAGTVTSAGTISSERVTITVTGNGGTPRLENAANGGWLQWASVLATSTTRIIDVRARTIVDSGGVTKWSELAAAQEWFGMDPGANVLTLTGAASIDVTYRPAYA